MDALPMETIELYCGEYDQRFVGRWLVRPDPDDTRADGLDYTDASWDAGYYWGIALTEGGQFAVYSAHCNGGDGSLAVSATLEEIEGVPPSILAHAKAALTGERVVIDRDI